MHIVNYSRSWVASVSGVMAGILGLDWMLGLGLFAATSLLLAVLLLVVKPRANASLYFPSSAAVSLGWWAAETSGTAFSYILFWTLAFGLVRLYN